MQQIDKKNTAFTAVIQHNEKSITRLAKVQYNAFQLGKKAIFVLSGVFLILLGVFGNMDIRAAGALAFMGCMIWWFSDLPARVTAARMNQAIGKKYPKVEYYFYEKEVAITDGKEWFHMPYKIVQRFFEDKEYWYLFLTVTTSYMIPKDALKKGDAQKFTTFIENRTGLKAEKPAAIMGLSLKGIITRIRNARSRKSNSKG